MVLPETLLHPSQNKVGPEVQGTGSCTLRKPQGLGNLRADLVTSTADRRTQMHVNPLRQAPELPTHHFQGTLQDSPGDAPPSSMQERNDPQERIHQKDGHTVRDGHTQEDRRGVREMAIRIQPEVEACSLLLGPDEARPMHQELTPVDLTGMDDSGKSKQSAEILPRLLPGGRRGVGE